MKPMYRTLTAAMAVSILLLATSRAQEAKFATDNLKYSRDFYAKVHFIAIAKLPKAFKYDRYPSGGPERIQCDEGTYARQHGKAWLHSNDRGRSGEPIDHAERDRFVMTFALKDGWGRTGEPVDKETARKLDGWIKLVEAALNAAPIAVKLADKSEADRAEWVFESPSGNPSGVPTRFTFRKPISDKNENVLLHEFSGTIRLEGSNVVPAGAADLVRLGFGYMMNGDGGYEVSEFVWEEMQAAEAENKSKSAKSSSPTPVAPARDNRPNRSSAPAPPATLPPGRNNR
jgi:hypothetical protein